MAIFLIYGIDVDIQGVLTKGNFDQMIGEVENLSKITKLYVSTKDSQSYSSLFKGKADHLTSKLFSLPDNSVGKLVESAIFFFVGFVSITRRLKDVEVIISQGTTVFQAAVANFLFHKPHIMFLHYLAYNEELLLNRKLLATLFRFVELFTMRHCSLVIAPNENLRTQALEHGAKSVQIIPNFVEAERIDKIDSRDILRKKFHFRDLKVLLFVGRLHPVKNIDLLLRSFKYVNASGDCILVIIGDGPERKRLTDLARSLGISDRVFFEGFKDKKVVLEYMKASDVLILPSLVEGQPRVILEAWASSLPVVASRRPGLETLINNGVDGLLFELGNEEKLAKTVTLAFDSTIAHEITSNAAKKVTCYGAVRVLSAQADIVKKFLSRGA